MSAKKKNFFQRIVKPFRLQLLDESNYHKIWSLKVSKLKFYSAVIFLVLLFLCSGAALIMFTPLKFLIKEFPTSEVRKQIIDNSMRVDSLVNLLEIQSRYLSNVKKILSGEINVEFPAGFDKNRIYNNDEDSLNEGLFPNLIRDIRLLDKRANISGDISKSHYSSIVFFPPVKGVISNTFLYNDQHFGIDIVAKPSSIVHASQSGTIISQAWTFESGNVIYIQHSNNFITVYKHNASFLRNQGDYVLTGEAIAVVGNTGEYSTGAHLHFEIWYNGIPVNPEDFISFN